MPALAAPARGGAPDPVEHAQNGYRALRVSEPRMHQNLVAFHAPPCYTLSHVTENHTVSSLPPLGDLEHEILTILWSGGEMTAAEVRRKIARKLKDATIRTVLRRLEEKGYVTHTVEAGTFIYRPTESADSAPRMR
jgi:uncharacterized membrane protein